MSCRTFICNLSMYCRDGGMCDFKTQSSMHICKTEKCSHLNEQLVKLVHLKEFKCLVNSSFIKSRAKIYIKGTK